MKKYLIIIKNGLMMRMARRVNFIFTFIGNLFYVVLVYFLWKAIYGNTTTTLNGMTFNQAFIYIGVASTIFILFQTYPDWYLSFKIRSGDIVMDLLKPLDVQIQVWAYSMGGSLSKLITTTLPCLIVIFGIFRASLSFGLNIPFFIISVVIAASLSYVFDFIIGITSFYTESIWGISVTKEALVLFLSGAIVPISFFPQNIQVVLRYLPFQAIYNIPLTILTSDTMGIVHYLSALLVQVGWLVVLVIISRLYYRKALGQLTINGG